MFIKSNSIELNSLISIRLKEVKKVCFFVFCFLSVSQAQEVETTSSLTRVGVDSGIGPQGVYFGFRTGINATGVRNVVLGHFSGTNLTTGGYNVFVGAQSGRNNTTGANNVFVGYQSGEKMTNSSGNVFVGTRSGYSFTEGVGNLFLGNYSGGTQTSVSNKLFIDNSNTDAPLIWGDFLKNIVNFNGKVGIGTTTPNQYNLDVHGTSNGMIRAYGSSIGRLSLQNSTHHYSTSVQGSTLLFFDETAGKTRMLINSSGNIGIGTSTTGTHKLAVEGSIGAREVKVEASGWSDFVFESDYDLPTLEEVEKHIQEKGHLKDIPSAKEVEENGISLGEMNAKLLQKIEELTLYVIAQNKEIQELKKQNKK